MTYPHHGQRGQPGPGAEPPAGFPHSGTRPQSVPVVRVSDGRPPEKRTTALTVGIVVTVVLLAGGVTALLLLTHGDGRTLAGTHPVEITGDPASLAQAAVDAFNTRNAARLAALSCNPLERSAIDGLHQELARAGDMHAALAGSPVMTGATAEVRLTLQLDGKTDSADLLMKQQGGKWCLVS